MADGAPSRTRTPRGTVVVAGLLGLALAGLALLRVVQAPYRYSIWSDRDLFRAAHLATDWPTAGAELSYGTGARIPGGAEYVLLALAQAVHDDPLTVQRGVLLLDTAGLGLLAWVAWRVGGPLAAAFAVAAGLGTAVTEEGLGQLWNPALLPVFVAGSAALLARMAERRSARLLPAWAAVVGLGAQMHLSMYVWAGAGLLVLPWLGVRGWRRALPLALGALVVVYLPHLVDEAVHGWPNTRAMSAQPHTRALALAAPVTWRFGEVVGSLAWLGGHAPSARLPAWTGIAAWAWAVGWAAGALAAFAGTRRGSDRARGLLAVTVATALSVGWLLTDPLIPTTVRYLVVAAPGVAITVGAGLASLAQATGRAAPLAALVAAGAVAAPASWWIDRFGDAPGGNATRSLAALDEARTRAGWTWTELAGRLVVVPHREGDRFGWAAQTAVEDVLRRQGAVFPGSLPPPCALLFQLPVPPDRDRLALVRELVRVGPGGPTLLSEATVGEGQLLLTYDPGLPLCATSLMDRYLDTPAEAVLRGPGEALAPGTALHLPSPAPGVRRSVVRLAAPTRADPSLLVVGVDLERAGGEVRATLHSNQLRGEALNEGWYAPALVHRPRLRFEPVAGGEPVELVIVDDLLGYRAAAAPVVGQAALGDGPWRVTLVLDLVDPLASPWPPTTWEAVRAEVGLHEVWPAP